jgi:autotransporter-associated beta strand protein
VGASTTSNLWSDPQNWELLSATGVPLGHAVPGVGADLLFAPGQKQLTNVDNLSVNFNSLTFTGTNYDIQPGISITLKPIPLAVNQITASQASGSNAVDSPINLAIGSTTFDVTSASASLALTGGLNDSNPVFGGNPVKTGSGILNLFGTSTYSGVTTVQQGVLSISSSTALGKSPQVDVLNGGTLELSNNVSISQEVSLNGAGFNNLGALFSAEGVNTVSGRVDLPTNAVINSGSSLTLSGQVFSPGTPKTLTIHGAVFMTGGTSNNYGATNVAGGFLDLDKSPGAIAVPGSLVVTGSVIIDSINETSPTTDVTLNPGSTFLLNSSDTINSLAMTGATVNANNGQLSLNGNVTLAPAAQTSAIFGLIDLGFAPNATDVVTRTFAVNGTLQITGTLENGGLGQVNLAKSGTGTMTLLGNVSNSYSGSTTVVQGTLVLGKGGTAVAIPGNLIIDPPGSPAGSPQVVLQSPNQVSHVVTVDANGVFDLNNQADTIAGLNMTGGVVQTEAGTLTLNGTVTSNPSPTPAVINGKITLGLGHTQTLNVAAGPAAQDLVVNAVVVDGVISKSGLGTLVLNGNNTNQFDEALVGTVLVNGFQPNTDIAVAVLGTFGGTGTVKQIGASQGGTVDPGPAPGQAGILHVASGGATFLSGSTFHVDLNGTAAGSFDQLNVAGLVNLGGANLTAALNFHSAQGDTFDILHAAVGISGTFATASPLKLVDPTTGVTDVFQILYTSTDVELKNLGTSAMFQNRSVTTPIAEGKSATLSGTIADSNPQGTFILQVNWGDGSPVQTFTYGPDAPRNVQLQHDYDKPGHHTVHLAWHDVNGPTNTAELAVIVHPAPHETRR